MKVHYIFFIRSSVGLLSCFHSLVIANNAGINISVQASLLYTDLPYFRYMPRRVITGSYGSSTFSYLRNLHNSCISLHSHQHCMLHSCQHLFLYFPLKVSILTGVKCEFFYVVSICISFTFREVEHSSCIYWPFVPLPLKIPYSIHFACFFIGILILG
jgi:hypothetical protein